MENESIEVPEDKVNWWHKILNTRNLIILIAVILIVRASFWVVCGQKETMLPIPKFLDGAQIIFNNQMYYETGESEQKTQTFKSIKREIVTDNLGLYYKGRFKYEPVSTSTKFSVIGALNNANCGLSAIDSGTEGVDFLVLQDEQGNKSLIPYIYFYLSFANGSLIDVTNASYYKNGERIDFIRKSDFDQE